MSHIIDKKKLFPLTEHVKKIKVLNEEFKAFVRAKKQKEPFRLTYSCINIMTDHLQYVNSFGKDSLPASFAMLKLYVEQINDATNDGNVDDGSMPFVDDDGVPFVLVNVAYPTNVYKITFCLSDSNFKVILV